MDLSEKIQLAFKLRNEGLVDKVIELLEPHKDEADAPVDLHILLGHSYMEMSEYGNAAVHFERATGVVPDFDLPSISLFICHWHMGEEERAWKEADRFLSSNYSMEYDLLFQELGKWPPGINPKGQQ